MRMSKDARFLYLYFLTCPEINLCGIFKLCTEDMAHRTGMEIEIVEKIIEELSTLKIVYVYNDWVYIVNAVRHNNYFKSPTIYSAYLDEVINIELSTIKFFMKKGFTLTLPQFDTTINSSMNTRQKTKTKNIKLKINNINKVLGIKNINN